MSRRIDRDLVRWLSDRGCTIVPPHGRGHPKVYYRGKYLTSMSKTPSDHRAVINMQKQVERMIADHDR